MSNFNTVQQYNGLEPKVLEHFKENYHPGIHTAFYSNEPFPSDHRVYVETVEGNSLVCFLQDDGSVAFREE